LEHIAEGLKQDIDENFGPNEPIDIVAFSMGGLVSRYYLQELGGAQRCQSLTTLASPHHGTQTAWLYPSKGAIQMRPGSEFLSNLNQSEPALGKMSIVSYRSRLDLVILPSTNSIWNRAENIEHPSLLHPFLLTSPKVMRDIERRLTE
jgi:triacylglycerol lipase